jgi:hypothetical protein
MHVFKSLTSALAAAALTLPGAAFAARGTQLPDGVARQSVPAAGVLHVSKGFYENWGTQAVQTAYFGNTPLDAQTTIKCPGLKACSLHTVAQVQWLPSVTAGEWDICVMVDGHFINKACYFQGTVSMANGFVSGTDLENWAMTPGTHTVQSFIYTEQVGTVASYQIDYMISVP